MYARGDFKGIKMVVISGTAIAIGVIGSAAIGGMTIYGVTKVMNGGEEFPPSIIQLLGGVRGRGRHRVT